MTIKSGSNIIAKLINTEKYECAFLTKDTYVLIPFYRNDMDSVVVNLMEALFISIEVYTRDLILIVDDDSREMIKLLYS